jgi:hypothetical protein
MVSVPVRDHNGLTANLFRRHGGYRIASDKRIDGEARTAVIHQETCVSEKRESYGHQLKSPEKSCLKCNNIKSNGGF